MALENPIGAGRLILTFVKGQDIRKVELLGQSPSVHFRLNTTNEFIKSPAHHHGNHTPVWNFPYVFDLKGDEHSLHIEVVHQGLIGTTFIGQADIPLMTLVANSNENWFRLTHGNHGESAGDISISAQWEPAQQLSEMKAMAPQQVYQQPPQPVYQQPPAFQQPAFVPQDPLMQQIQQFVLLERIRDGGIHRIALRGSNGFWLHAAEYHKVHCSGRDINHHSTWQVLHHEGRIALRSGHGKFLAAYGDGRVAADRDEHSHSERFGLEELGNGMVALRTHHGTYLGADGEGPLVQRGGLGQHEQFYMQVID